MARSNLSAAELHRLFEYDPDTGVFTRKVRPSRAAGAHNGFGHRQIRVLGTLYMAHRLAWLYVYGEWPSTYLDHINGKPDDNRIVNLRPATCKQNQENTKLNAASTSGYRGVNWHAGRKRWVARIAHHKARVHVGDFRTLEAAVIAVRAKRDVLYTHHKTEHAAP